MKAGGDEEAAEGKSEAGRGWFRSFKKEAVSLKVQGGAARAGAEAAASCPEDLAETVNERAALNNRFSV